MSLRSAIQVITKELGTRLAGGQPLETAWLYSIYDQLAVALKASEEEEQTKKPVLLVPENERRMMAERAQRDANNALVNAARAEAGSRMVPLQGVGDDLDGTFIETEARMPAGAKMPIGGKVFVLSADREILMYSAEETEKYQAARKR